MEIDSRTEGELFVKDWIDRWNLFQFLLQTDCFALIVTCLTHTRDVEQRLGTQTATPSVDLFILRANQLSKLW